MPPFPNICLIISNSIYLGLEQPFCFNSINLGHSLKCCHGSKSTCPFLQPKHSSELRLKHTAKPEGRRYALFQACRIVWLEEKRVNSSVEVRERLIGLPYINGPLDLYRNKPRHVQGFLFTLFLQSTIAWCRTRTS